jgi:hypothetical protein
MLDHISREAERLRLGERKALREFAPFDDFEPLSKHPRLGLGTLRELCAKELAEEGPAGVFGPTFKLTDHGRRLLAAADAKGSRRDGSMMHDIRIAHAGPDELEVVLIAQKTRTAVRMNAANARRLAGELSVWAELNDRHKVDRNAI